jgi:hypothetical protein
MTGAISRAAMTRTLLQSLSLSIMGRANYTVALVPNHLIPVTALPKSALVLITILQTTLRPMLNMRKKMAKMLPMQTQLWKWSLS